MVVARRSILWFTLLFILPLFIAACSKEESRNDSIPEFRNFRMGFTAFPYDLSLEALRDAFNYARDEGDVFLTHLDMGVPWDEVKNDLPFPSKVKETLDGAITLNKPGQKLFLSATPTSQERNALALMWNDNGEHQPLPFQWINRKFNDPIVIETYIKYCKRLIDYSNPDYFAFGIEVNASFKRGSQSYVGFLHLAEATYTQLKESYPSLPIFMTFQDQAFNKTRPELIEMTEELLEFSDIIAMSTYPFWLYDFPTRDANPALLNKDRLSTFRNLDRFKPFAISETAYIAEDLIMESIGVNIKGSESWQNEYLDILLSKCQELEAEFLIWFISRDYDALYESIEDPEVILRVWKDTGLRDGAGNQRPSYHTWMKWLELSVN